MWINGRDLDDDGWTLTGLAGWMAGASVQRGVTALQNIGGVVPNSQYTVDQRTMPVTFERSLTSITDRDAALYTLQDRLRGLLWVRFDDAPARVVRCIATPLVVEPMAEVTVFSVAAIRVRCTLIAYDGASYDTEPQVRALATTPVEIPLGTLPSGGIVTWGGAWTATTARTLILRDAGGVARTTMTVTAPSGESLASTDFLEIDLLRRYVTKVTSAGVRTNEYDWYTSGDWITLDPAYQDRAATRYATLEISAGTAQITYRKAYAL